MTPGDLLLLMAWGTKEGAQAFEDTAKLSQGARLRRGRIVRDYGMFDRREALRYYPDAERQQRGA